MQTTETVRDVRLRTAAACLACVLAAAAVAWGVPPGTLAEPAFAQPGELTIIRPVGHISDNSTLLLDRSYDIAAFEHGGHAYAAVTAFRDHGLQIVSLADPHSPRAAGQLNDTESTLLKTPFAVAAFEHGGHAYAAVISSPSSGERGLQVISLADPDNPRAAGRLNDTGDTLLRDALDMATFEHNGATYAAVASFGEHGVQIVDLSDPADPRAAGRIGDDDGALELRGATAIATFEHNGATYAAVASQDDDGVQIINMSNPADPRAAGRIGDGDGGAYLSGAAGIATFGHGNRTYAAVTAADDAAVQLIDLSDPQNPRAAGSIIDGDFGDSEEHHVLLEGAAAIATFEAGGHTYAAVTSTAEPGVQFVDLSDPADPRAAGRIRDTGSTLLFGAISIAVFEAGTATYAAFASAEEDGVQVILLDGGNRTYADAGPDLEASAGGTVALDGSGSTGRDIDYSWEQTGGTPAVPLAGAGTPSPSFEAPGESAVLRFTLTVTDGANRTDTDTVTVRVHAATRADAGPDLYVEPGATVALDGSNSAGRGIDYSWEQTAGTPAVPLSGAATPSPSFEAPGAAATLEFTLTVTDASSQSDTDAVTVFVRTPQGQAFGPAGHYVTFDDDGDPIRVADLAVFEVSGSPYAVAAIPLGSSLQIVDLSNPASPRAAGQIRDTGSTLLGAAAAVATFEAGSGAATRPYAVASSSADRGLQIVDLSNPASPRAAGQIRDTNSTLLGGHRAIATFEVSGSPFAVALSSSSSGELGLQIVNLTDPQKPRAAGQLSADDSLILQTRLDDVTTFELDGAPFAAVTSLRTDGMVLMINLTDPYSPRMAGQLRDTGSTLLEGATAIAAFEHGGTVYAAAASSDDDGVQLINMSNPADPRAAGQIRDTGSTSLGAPEDIAIFELDGAPYAAVISKDEHAVQTIDLSDPQRPIPLDRLADDGSTLLLLPENIATFTVDTATYAAVTSGIEGGVQIVRLDAGGKGIAVAGPDQTVTSGQTVTLDGTGSAGDGITYNWNQVSGPDSGVDRRGSARTTFAAPEGPATLVFELTVSGRGQNVDDDDIDPERVDTVTVTVLAPAKADAGPDLDVLPGDTVTLDGSNSTGDGLTFSWEQTGGGADVVLNPVRLAPAGGLPSDDPDHAAAPADPSDIAIYAPTSASAAGRTHAVVPSFSGDAVHVIDLSDPAAPAATDLIDAKSGILLNGATDVAVFHIDGHPYAAVASFFDNAVQILYISDPDSITHGGNIRDGTSLKLEGASGIATFEAGGLPYAAVASSIDNGVQLIDLTSPEGPAAEGSIADTGSTLLEGATAIATFEHGGRTYAAVASYIDNGVQLIDVSDPSRPRAAGHLADGGSTLLGGASGIATFDISGTAYAAVASYIDNGVQLVDVSDPGNPRAAGRLADNGTLLLDGASDIAVFEAGGRTYAAVASSEDDGVQMIDLTDPQNPRPVRGLPNAGSLLLDVARNIAVFGAGTGTYAAVASPDGVQIIDVLDFAAPYFTAPATPGTLNFTLTVTDPLSQTDEDAVTVTVFEPPRADAGTDRLVAPGDTVALDGSNSTGGGRLSFSWEQTGGGSDVDLDLETLLAAGRVPDGRTLELDGARAVDIFRAGSGGDARTYAAVASFNDDGVQLLDITDPADPRPAGRVPDGASTQLNGARGITAFERGGHTYAAVTSLYSDGLQIVNMSDPDDPRGVGRLRDTGATLLDDPYGVATFERGGRTYAAVASQFADGVQIVDLSDPSRPRAAGQIEDDASTLLDGASGIAAFERGGRTYAAVTSLHNAGLQLIDVSDPSDPRAAGQIRDNSTLLLAGAYGIATFDISGTTYAAAASFSDNGVQLIDVSDPSDPRAAGHIRDGGTLELRGAQDITVFEHGGRTYAAVASFHDDGVQLIDVSDPADPRAAGRIKDAGPTLLDGAAGIAAFEHGGTVYAAVASERDDGVQLVPLFSPAAAHFTAPEPGPEVLEFTLTVTDSVSQEDADTVAITVQAPPTADAGADRLAGPGQTVVLDASGSEGTGITHSWEQTGGEAGVTLGLGPPEPAGRLAGLGPHTIDGAYEAALFEHNGATYAAATASYGDAVWIADLSDPDSPRAAGLLADNSTLLLDNARGIAAFEHNGTTYAAVASRTDHGVQLIDLSNPSDPRAAGRIADNGTLLLYGAFDIALFEHNGDTYAAVASRVDYGVQLIDLSDPYHPRAAGHIRDTDSTLLRGAWGIATFHISGAPYAAVTSEFDHGVQLIDLSDPDSPRTAGRIGDNGTLLLHGAFDVAPFEHGGATYAAVTTFNEGGVQLIDLSDPDSPRAAGQIRDSGSTLLDTPNGIAVFGHGGRTYAAVAEFDGHGVQLIDLSDPDNPRAAGQIRDSGSTLLRGAQGVATFESGGATHLVVTGFHDDAVQLLRIPGTAFTAPGSPGPLEFTLTVTDSQNQTDTDTVTVTVPHPPTADAGGDRTAAPGQTVTLDGSKSAGTGLAYSWNQTGGAPVALETVRPRTAGGLQGGDFSARFGNSYVDTFEASGSTYGAVASAFGEGVQLIDLSDPHNLTAAGRLMDGDAPAGELLLTGTYGLDVFEARAPGAAAKTYAAVASEREDGVQLIDLSDPDNPRAAGRIGDNSTLELDGARSVAAFYISGAAYVAVASPNDDGLQLIDMSDPGSPRAAGRIADTEPDGAAVPPITVNNELLLDGASGVAVFEAGGRTYAAVASFHDDGVQLVDVSDPANPRPAGRIGDTEPDGAAVPPITAESELLLNGAYGIDVFGAGSGVYAAVASQLDHGVQLIDVSDPSEPEGRRHDI